MFDKFARLVPLHHQLPSPLLLQRLQGVLQRGSCGLQHCLKALPRVLVQIEQFVISLVLTFLTPPRTPHSDLVNQTHTTTVISSDYSSQPCALRDRVMWWSGLMSPLTKVADPVHHLLSYLLYKMNYNRVLLIRASWILPFVSSFSGPPAPEGSFLD